MTRFLLSLDQAVDTIFAAAIEGKRGETYVPRVPSACVLDIAKVMIGARDIAIKYTGIRPGEKIDEILISEEECFRAVMRGDYYVILPILPELRGVSGEAPSLESEYSSKDNILGRES